MWRNHYGQLLNQNEVSSNKGDLTVFDFDECKTDTYETIKPYFCTFQLAQLLSQKLKLNCAPGFDGLSVYHIVLAHEILLLHISMFFNLCLVHCYVPNLCSYSVLTPIIKSKHDDVTAISNYRPIALATIFSKFLELFILHMIKEFLVSVDNQFGFKSSHSTDMSLFLLKQTIAQYNHNGSPVFVAFLDASKAFDKVNHGVLFKKLVEAKVPMIFVHLLARWYSSQRSCVKWNSAYSESFSTANGVRQGSILSPFLFAIYMNELSLILNKLNIGCFIGNRCLNNIMYADDICCLAPSFKGLQKLLDICCDYANRHDITFNCTKTKTMMFKTNRLSLSFEPKFRLCGNSIDCVKKIKYLGFVLTSDLKDDDDMNRQLRSIYGSANKLRRKFFCCSKAVKNCLFRTFVSCLYGSTVWCMYRKSMLNRLRVGYNNAYRILFNLPRRTSMSTTLVQNNVPTFHALIRKHTVNFMLRCINSCNVWLSALVRSSDFRCGPYNNHFANLHQNT